MYFIVTDDNFQSEDIEEILDHCMSVEYYENDDYIEEWVNEEWNGVTINGVDYYPYDIVERFGNIGDIVDIYCERQYENDKDNYRYDLRHAEDGDTLYIQGCAVVAHEDGDTDGDNVFAGNSLDEVREFVKNMHIKSEKATEETNAEQCNYLNMFQILGG